MTEPDEDNRSEDNEDDDDEVLELAFEDLQEVALDEVIARPPLPIPLVRRKDGSGTFPVEKKTDTDTTRVA